MKLLKNITLGASFLLANACTSANQNNTKPSVLEQRIKSKSDQLFYKLRENGLEISQIRKLQIASETSKASFVFTSSNYSKLDKDYLQAIYKELGYVSLEINTDQKTFYIALNKSEFLSLKNSNPCLIDEDDLHYHFERQKIYVGDTDNFQIDSQFTINSFYFEVYKKIVRYPNLETLLKDILTQTKYTPIVFNDSDNQRLIAIAVDISEVVNPIDHSDVNQITSETSAQTCKQLDLELDSYGIDPLEDFIINLESAGFEIHSYESFINPMYAHLNGGSQKEIEELRAEFLSLPNSGFMLVSKSSLDTEAKLRELLKIAEKSTCFVGIVNPDTIEDEYKINIFCGDDINKLKR
ncbi:hypothetical protein CL656_03010 [bacterium]|nr:hypothetical protein [bacterium]|tara:strand:+ start:3699 stop:4757 length:1059 start_codon:yes stop_codon:yes gene_type:complete